MKRQPLGGVAAGRTGGAGGGLQLAWRMAAVALAAWQRESRARRRVLSCGDPQGETVGRAVASGCRGGNPQP